jgi:hypothetical protein
VRNLISLQFGLFLFLALVTSPAFGGSLRFKVIADLGIDVPASDLNSRDEVLVTYHGAPAVWSPLSGFTRLALPDKVPSSTGNPSDTKAIALNDKGQMRLHPVQTIGGITPDL